MIAVVMAVVSTFLLICFLAIMDLLRFYGLDLSPAQAAGKALTTKIMKVLLRS